MLSRLQQLKKDFQKEFKNIRAGFDVEKISKKYLGRKSELKQILRSLKDLANEERKRVGSLANEFRVEIEQEINRLKQEFSLDSKIADSGFFDETIPGNPQSLGHLHPITEFKRRLCDIFISIGFEIADGPEVETQEINFDLLNFPKNHPARDMQDTFYIKFPISNFQFSKNRSKDKDQEQEDSSLVLRTHTSSVQIRAMRNRKPPVRIIAPGRVFRHEATDASHETTFYQLEGLVIDKGVRITDLIGILDQVLKTIFGPQTKIRVRPSFFPFTEPSIEVDMSCVLCQQQGLPADLSSVAPAGAEAEDRMAKAGCSVCKKTGWLEMLGAGMVHPNVLKNMKVPHPEFSGFAFGIGIERLLMLYYGIDDIRLFYSGDLRFVRQF